MTVRVDAIQLVHFSLVEKEAAIGEREMGDLDMTCTAGYE